MMAEATPGTETTTAPVTDPVVTDPSPATDAPVLGTEQTQDPAPTTDPATDPAKVEDPAPEPEITADSYTFQMPEGMEIDAEIGAQFKEFAASKKLTNEEAQQLLDLSTKAQEKQAEAFRATQAEWVNQAKADKDFGGAKFDENLAVANKALDAFGTPELKTLLRTSGFGNHPEVIRAFVNVGKAVGEDKLVVRSTLTPPAAKKDPVSFYDKSNMK